MLYKHRSVLESFLFWKVLTLKKVGPETSLCGGLETFGDAVGRIDGQWW